MQRPSNLRTDTAPPMTLARVYRDASDHCLTKFLSSESRTADFVIVFHQETQQAACPS